MSTSFNPFVQGWDIDNVSLFGALPTWAPPTSMPRDALVFYITNYRPTILNSTVLNSRGQQQLRILTEYGQARPTLWLDAQQRTVAFVDWDVQPAVEIPGLLARTLVKDWLRVSSNRTSRSMEVRGVQYQWMPVDQYICVRIFSNELSINMLVRIHHGQNNVTLEISQEAMQHGLLEVSVIAATIFLSGANLS